ncbi:EAL domain-containing protein [Alicyclobacillus tolerans]|uniref:putative bifunctional diguanylate cyclase/phosphodiesterase n=1 Tax=Alicyclobacillus tolerans TaxID=90970 RepID=UPI001F21F89C|nr:EAL domain-containing protein [Alicyclobacillus tolerans]MCF8566567.1 EAL domain-containing protein [Alicyclobacillus tolerans]
MREKTNRFNSASPNTKTDSTVISPPRELANKRGRRKRLVKNADWIQENASEERYQAIVESIQEGYFEVDLAGNVMFFNRRMIEMHGFAEQEFHNLNYKRFIDERDHNYVFSVYNKVFRTGIPQKLVDYQIIRKDGTRFDAESSVTLMLNEHGDPIGFRGILRDVSNRKEIERQMRYLAYHDPLTHLPNRAAFNERLVQDLSDRIPIAVLFIDLDRFKRINDTFGHSFGDRVLQSVASRLEACLDTDVFLSRWGGDEFTLLVRNIHNKSELQGVLMGVVQSVSEVLTIDDREFHLTPSIGAILSSDLPKASSEDLLRLADAAMYVAKGHGGGIHCYTPKVDVASRRGLLLEQNLYKAMKQQELSVHYQPKVSTSSGHLVGVEALLRWPHPVYGPISPAEFIPIAEESDLISEIGEWVFYTACAQVQQWRLEGYPNLSVAINLSPRQFLHESLTSLVDQVLRSTGLPGSLLELEITEGILLDPFHDVTSIIHTLRNRGVRIFLDDFGTGYSSLSYLRQIPLDGIKIDKSFVKDLKQPQSVAITETMVHLAHILDLHVVAEGVETEETAERLKELNCDQLQGYWIAKPMSSGQFSIWLHHTAPFLSPNAAGSRVQD